MWTKYIHHFDYSSEYGTVKLQNILIGEICLINHHIFLIPLLHNTSLINNNRLIIHSNQMEINLLVYQQENNHHMYFIVDNHRQNDYSNLLLRSIETKNTCIIF